MKLLVTAGPTREAIDPVRFISNRSSGKMGYAVARAAQRRGHSVRLISGPVCIDPPQDVPVTRVITAEDMLSAVSANLDWCEALVMAAAVADWRPAVLSPTKLKKREAATSIELERTPDILTTILPLKGVRMFVGFAAETHRVIEEAERKLSEKGLDLIVANDVSRSDSGFEADHNEVTFLMRDGGCQSLPLMRKEAVAEQIMDWLERRTAGLSLG